MKYVFVAQHKKTWPVDLMCQLLGITRSGYYGYQRRGGSGIDHYHEELMEAVEDIPGTALQEGIQWVSKQESAPRFPRMIMMTGTARIARPR